MSVELLPEACEWCGEGDPAVLTIDGGAMCADCAYNPQTDEPVCWQAGAAPRPIQTIYLPGDQPDD